MPSLELGTLEQIDLRKAWSSESGDFTPWLAKEENLRLLGVAIGMDLELEAQEKNVGPFRADILCRNTGSATGDWVLIENQLERTDHSHLGQILTYAAGLQAVTIVWISKEFTEEHRAALDWLNEITDEKIRFFGIEIELWKIGVSAVAPKFNLVSKPNDWTKSGIKVIDRTTTVTPNQEKQRDFWKGYVDYLLEKKYSLTRVPKPQPQCWSEYSVGRGGFVICPIASAFNSEKNSFGGELRMELVINHQDAKEFFKALIQHKEAVESKMGETLTWQDRGERVRQCKIFTRKDVKNIFEQSCWPSCYAWLYEKMMKFQHVFRPIVSELTIMTPDD